MNISCWTKLADGRPALFPASALSIHFGKIAPDNTIALSSDGLNFAACINEAARLAGNGLLITLPPDLVALAKGALLAFSNATEQSPGEVFFYGDYDLQSEKGTERVSVRQDIGDITEREDWGPVWAVRVDWLLSVGGLDEEHHKAAFYDLLLKSWNRRAHIGTATGTVRAPEQNSDQSDLKNKLFFPGRGKLGGFSYLFMDKEEERHIENVFYNFLKREHAWLEGPRPNIPHTSTPMEPIAFSPVGAERSEFAPAFTEGESFLSPAFTEERPVTSASVKGGRGAVFVSVVTPVYNRARFIGKAIESVERQTLTDWEYVIVDNGSTDDTRDVVREYAAKNPRIRLIENDKNIIAHSLNIGVRHAHGKYIAQLDSDDEYLPYTLKLMTDALETNPTWGLAISYYELMDEAGNSLPEFGVIRHEQYNRNNILRRDGAGALRCWHRSVILEFGGFDEKELGHYGEDYDLVLKCGEKYEVGRVHEVCYRYRRHPDNTDVLREPEMKIVNKTKARLHALARRKKLSR